MLPQVKAGSWGCTSWTISMKQRMQTRNGVVFKLLKPFFQWHTFKPPQNAQDYRRYLLQITTPVESVYICCSQIDVTSPATVAGKADLFPPNHLCCFVKDEFAVLLWVCFPGLCFDSVRNNTSSFFLNFEPGCKSQLLSSISVWKAPKSYE